ncbi:MAG: hypothetical protein DDT27_00332 [Dehalococcoidia bacterium]|nr:hypothetical protein [Chloroflexota bacterium]MBT9161793.1 hypothetical protein [Chloroflexota bacterium]
MTFFSARRNALCQSLLVKPLSGHPLRSITWIDYTVRMRGEQADVLLPHSGCLDAGARCIALVDEHGGSCGEELTRFICELLSGSKRFANLPFLL